ncbi:MAG: hypothetical protein GY696_07355 [Gammaproteobacteria bacterium]|nr:hypothetical protein [Gammaproteobacteria bacterium]
MTLWLNSWNYFSLMESGDLEACPDHILCKGEETREGEKLTKNAIIDPWLGGEQRGTTAAPLQCTRAGMPRLHPLLHSNNETRPHSADLAGGPPVPDAPQQFRSIQPVRLITAIADHPAGGDLPNEA